MSPAQRCQGRQTSQGRPQQDALALGACGRAQQTMGGERGLRRRRPVSGLSAAHIPPLFPRPAARVADALPHQAFPSSCAALEAERSPGGSGGRRGGRTDGGRAGARCDGGGLQAAIRMGGYCLRAALQAGTAGFAAHRGFAGHPTLSTLDPT
ncbi:hypothetical protein NN561_001490 [Cricetulus griseus]